MVDDTRTEIELAAVLDEVIEQFTEPGTLRRLKRRVRELGAEVRDEVQQFRLLQRACDESRDLGRALATSGLGIVASMDTRRVSPETGRLIQAFNRLVEEKWRAPG